MITDTSGQDIALSPTKKPWRRWLVMGVLLLASVTSASLALGRWLDATPNVQSDRLRLATVTQGDLVRDFTTSARVVSGFSPTLFSPTDGSVRFLVSAGDDVTKGQIIAEIDSPELQNQLEQEQARLHSLRLEVKRQILQNKRGDLNARKAVEEARVKLNAALREFQRNSIAADKGLINEVELLRSEDELANAQIAFRHAEEEAELDRANREFEQATQELTLRQQELAVAELTRVADSLTITAPIDGRVGNLLVAERSQVAQNAGLVSIVDLTQLEIEAQIPEIYADDLQLGLTSLVQLGGNSAMATVAAISPEITDGKIATRLRFSDTLPAGLRQNQRVQAKVLLESHHQVVKVSRGPFFDEGAGRVAYRVNDGFAERIKIEVGATSVGELQVIAGLSVGDQIVISSIEEFKSAERIRIN
jgi:HlyD family secretion protein